MDDAFFFAIVFLFCVIFISSVTATGSFQYYAIKSKAHDSEIREFLDGLRFPLNKPYNVTNQSLFMGIRRMTALEFVKSGDVLSAQLMRGFNSVVSLICIFLTVVGVFQLSNVLHQLIIILIIMAEIIIMIKAWRFGSKLGR